MITGKLAAGVPGREDDASAQLVPAHFQEMHDRVDHRCLGLAGQGSRLRRHPLPPSARSPGQDMLRDTTTLTGPSPMALETPAGVGQLRQPALPGPGPRFHHLRVVRRCEDDRPAGAGDVPDLQAGRGDRAHRRPSAASVAPSATAHNSSPLSSQAGTPAASRPRPRRWPRGASR